MLQIILKGITSGLLAVCLFCSACSFPLAHRYPKPTDFPKIPAIWPHTGAPQEFETALFRGYFSLDKNMKSTQVQIFADTRYELWLDGVWVGRGPARFSKKFREYDSYSLPAASPGRHTLAVLVQWAPSVSRSESQFPLLQIRVTANRRGATVQLAETGTDWRALQSDAWRSDAAPVHSARLIGPTELLDLSRLPQGWQQSGFDDQSWQPAQLRQEAQSSDWAEGAVFQPRSIPFLIEEKATPGVLESGFLSPGKRVFEFSPNGPETRTITIDADTDTVLIIETLGESREIEKLLPPQAVFSVDGNPVKLESSSPSRPGVYAARVELPAGRHWLSIGHIPQAGMTVILSSPPGLYTSLTPALTQTNHAGRRLLLAEPVPDPKAVRIESSEEGFNATFVNSPAYLVLDLGKVVYGRITLTVNGPPGALLDIGWDERLYPNTSRPLPYPGYLHPAWNQVDSWTLDGSRREIRTIDARTGRYILIAVWSDTKVTLEDIRVQAEHYPVVQKGSLQIGDQRLEKVWQVGVDTLLINMTDAYADPWRERGQWWGDAYVADQINQVAFGDSLLLRRGLLLMAHGFEENGRPHAMAPGIGGYMLDYGMEWIFSVSDYFSRTQDASLVKEIFPILQKFLRYCGTFEAETTGLLDLPAGHWSQSVYLDTMGASDRVNQSTAANSLYYQSLTASSFLAASIGEDALAESWKAKAALLKETINRLLFDRQNGWYAAGIQDGKRLDPTPLAQAYALACGVYPQEDRQRIARALVDRVSSDPTRPNVGTFGLFWVLKGLGEAGAFEEALQMIDRHYGYMLNQGATTWWEYSRADQHYQNSYSHAWSGGPTWFLTRYLLGLRVDPQGRWVFQPSFSSFNSVSGAVPLEAGTVTAGWQKQEGEARLNIGAQSIPGTVRIDQSAGFEQVWLDGKLIWGGGAFVSGVVTEDSGFLVIAITGGEHSIQLK